MEAQDPVEAAVWKFKLLGVAMLEFDMTPVVLACLRDRSREHVGRWIDTDDVNVGRIGVERDAGSNPNLKHSVPGTKGQRFQHLVLMVDECPPKDSIVEMGQIGVDAAFMRFGHRVLTSCLAQDREIQAGG